MSDKQTVMDEQTAAKNRNFEILNAQIESLAQVVGDVPENADFLASVKLLKDACKLCPFWPAEYLMIHALVMILKGPDATIEALSHVLKGDIGFLQEVPILNLKNPDGSVVNIQDLDKMCDSA